MGFDGIGSVGLMKITIVSLKKVGYEKPLFWGGMLGELG